jgi:MFS family permease
MQLSNLVRLVVFIGMTVAVALHAPPALVIVLAALGTSGGVAYRPASSALLPKLVGESGLAPAMAFLSTLYSLAIVAGPALGAAVLAFGSPALAFAINAATFGVSSLFLRAITSRSAGLGGEAEVPPSSWRMFVDGLAALRDTPYVPVLTLLCVVGALAYGAETVLLVVYAEEQLGVGADGYGYLIAGAGAGGVAAGLFCARLAGRRAVAVVTTVSCGLSSGGLLLYAGTSLFAVALAIAVLTGMALVVSEVVTDLAITRAAPGDLLGRVYGALEGIATAGTVLGAALAPVTISAFGLEFGMLAFGGIAAVITLATFPRLRSLDRAALAAVDARASRLRLLTVVGVLNGAAPSALEQLAEHSTEVAVPKDVEVVRQGAAADAFYIVVEGTLTVLLSREGTRPEPVRTLGAGDWFGEIGLLERVPRTATVRSDTPCRLLRIGAEEFFEALTRDQRMFGPLNESASARLAFTHPAWRNRREQDTGSQT